MLVNRRGFTLMEMMIVVAIFMFIVTAMLWLFSGGKNSWNTQDIQSELYLNARKAMDEMTRELAESGRNTVTIQVFQDPINSEYHEAICFASGRGSDGVASEDGSHTNNNYVHWKASGNVDWRSAVIYCPYQTAEGIKQLRRYVDYGTSTTYYGTTGIFSLTFVSITDTTITLLRGDSSTFTINRDTDPSMTILANYIDTEDTNNNNALDANERDGNVSAPVDNADLVLNTGVNYTLTSGRLSITFFLRREVARLVTAGRFIVFTLKNTVQLRQP